MSEPVGNTVYTVGQKYVNRRWPSGANIEDRQGFLEPWFAKIPSDSISLRVIVCGVDTRSGRGSGSRVTASAGDGRPVCF